MARRLALHFPLRALTGMRPPSFPVATAPSPPILPVTRGMFSTSALQVYHRRRAGREDGERMGDGGSGREHQFFLPIAAVGASILVGRGAALCEDVRREVEVAVKVDEVKVVAANDLAEKGAILFQSMITKAKELMDHAVLFLKELGALLKAHMESIYEKVQAIIANYNRQPPIAAPPAGYSAEKSHEKAGVDAKMAAADDPTPGEAKSLVDHELVMPVPEMLQKYFPVFIFVAISLALLGLSLSLRSRDKIMSQIKSQVSNATGSVIRANMSASNHPRRATELGALQESEAIASFVREVLEIISANAKVSESLGKRLKEGKATMMRDKSGYMADLPVSGDTGAQAKVSIVAVKSGGGQFSCTSISVTLPGEKTPFSVPMAQPEKAGA